MCKCKSIKSSFFIVGLSLFTAISCVNKAQTKEVKPIKVKTTSLKRRSSVADQISYSGVITPEKSINLSFQVSGTLKSIKYDMGTYVKKGALIAEIDQTVYLRQYEVQKAQAVLAKENYQRIKAVYDKGSIAEIRLIEARSRYDQAKAAAAAIYQNLKHTKIYAPISGYIGKKMLEAGDLASPGVPVVSLLKIDKVKAVTPLPDIEVNNYKIGDSAFVSIKALANRQFLGNIDEISVQSNTGMPAYKIKVKIDNEALAIKPGMICRVSLQGSKASETKNFIIPVETVIPDEKGRTFVYVSNKARSRAMKIQVQVGRLSDHGIEVLSGLNAGDQLITSGYHKLTNQTPIQIID